MAVEGLLVNQQDTTFAKINPATKEGQDTANASLAAIEANLIGTGLPISLAVADPGDNDWSDALDPNPVIRACKRLTVWVGNSGVQISFDGGTTTHCRFPAGAMDDRAINIPAGSDVRVKRYTADRAMTDLVVEVR